MPKPKRHDTMGRDTWRAQAHGDYPVRVMREALGHDEDAIRAEFESFQIPPGGYVSLWHRPAGASRFKRIDARRSQP